MSPSHSTSLTKAGRILRVMLICMTLSLMAAPALPLGVFSSLAPVALRPPVVAAAVLPVGCEVEGTQATYPAANSTIVADRRQPWAGTTTLTPTLSIVGNTISFQQGQVTIAGLKSMLDAYATDTYTNPLQIAQTSNLLVPVGANTWLLRANLRIGSQAGLSVIDGTNAKGTGTVTTTLRIESTAAISPALEIRNYGYLRFDHSTLLSWDSTKNAPDQNYADGRAYVVSYEGGRMDFYNSEVSYLGYKDGEASGIAWRKCADDTNNTTGATGDIQNSNIHNNFFGMYSYEAYGIWANNNLMHDNVLYGFDPHDYSQYFIFENNKVYNNGKHGIIFSRRCDYNIIRNNTVSGSRHHGIMLDRRSNYNQILNNTVFNNEDGIAIFQSRYNFIKGNNSYNNLTGMRINATPVPPENGVPDRTPDQTAIGNQILNNTFAKNRDYGIYLYNRSDSTTISGNTITGNGRRDGTWTQPSGRFDMVDDTNAALGSGVQIKTGGNTIGAGNIFANNGHGLSMLKDSADPDPVGGADDPEQSPTTPASGLDTGLPTATQNTVFNNTFTGSLGRGVRMVGANNNIIKQNEIAASVDEGIYSDSGSNNLFQANFIHNNGAPAVGNSEGVSDNGSAGVNIKGVGASGNKLTQNRITANGNRAIKIGVGANNNITAPTIVANQTTQVSGTALPGATIEVFNDPKTGCGASVCGDEAANYIGTTTADSGGTWVLMGITTQNNYSYSATQTDANGNTSQLSSQVTAPTVTVAPGRKGEKTIYVSGDNPDLTLPQVQAILQNIGQGSLLTSTTDSSGAHIWTLNASLFISPTVTLRVVGGLGTNQSVDWLRLFSDPGPSPAPNPADPSHPIYDANYFATIKTYYGNLYFQDTKVTSWDRVNQKLDEDIHDGRGFVLAKYGADMTIVHSDMSYLGYHDGEAYGVAWRDVDPTINKDGTPYVGPKQIRVTGQAINSIFSHNYYGIYTFQAHDMTFSGNKMFSNIQYGFDPHDFTHDVIVDGNESYNNGSHGFIISRGCSNFVFRNNISHDNKHVEGISKNHSSHAFMLDPGADPAVAGVPQSPSTNNLIENNVAYGNDGYAVRVFGSTNNTIRNNLFYNNRLGITLENGSTGNTIENNTIKDSTGEAVTDTTGATSIKGGYGVYAFGGSDNTTVVSNTITGNINTGVYLKTGNNLVQNNLIANNKSDGIGSLLETTSELPSDPPTPDDESILTPKASIASLASASVTVANASPTTPTNNTMSGNTVQNNQGAGMSLKGSTGPQVNQNRVAFNGQDGIYLSNGTTGAVVSTNSITGNQGYGIKVNGADVQNNLLTMNVVTGNVTGGIAVTSGANSTVIAPTKMHFKAAPTGDTAAAGSMVINGITTAGATVEIFSDNNTQAAFYEGTVQADNTGAFTFTTNGPPQGSNLTATATDTASNTSSLSKPAKAPSVPDDTGYTVYLPIIVK